MSELKNVSEVEIIKDKSRYLRGSIVESLANDITGALFADDTQLIKFHGSYQQADRDLDSERKKQKLEPLYSFMIRVRVPGGIATPQQWLTMSNLADTNGNGTMKLTTRQAFQLHGVLKRDLRATIQAFNDVRLDSIAGCGDVNRNVMCNPNPHQSAAHAEMYADAVQISAHLTPRTSSYWEIWLDGQRMNADGEPLQKTTAVVETKIGADDEPIYGKHYLPRKFKIALALPPYNDVDIFANDIGLIGIVEDEILRGYNVAIGGGFGMTFGMPDTYPRLADVIGFVEKSKIVDVCEKIMTVQRDWGNRENRKFSRLKYTIDRVGLDVFKAETEKRLGFLLENAKPYTFERNGDVFGWSTNPNGNLNLSLFIEGGRIANFPPSGGLSGENTEGVENKNAPSATPYFLKKALEEVAKLNDGDFRLTGNQNLMICNLKPRSRPKVEAILEKYGVLQKTFEQTGLRSNSIACVAFNTCTLAFAEAERYLPTLIDKIDLILRGLDLSQAEIVIRMTGCPNGCGRPYLGEIGFVGRAIGRYNMYLGAAFDGSRLNKLYREMLNEDEILAALKPILEDYAQNHNDGEHFGDFTIRKNYVKATTQGLDFHN